MTDSDEEEKLEYLKKDLFQPRSRPWQHQHQNRGEDKLGSSPSDDDSNRMFMFPIERQPCSV